MPVSVSVTFKGKKHSLEVSPEEGFEVFRFQVFSITDVEPESQKLLVKGKPVRNDDEFSAINVADGMVFFLLVKPPSEVTEQLNKTLEEQPLFQEDIQEWRTACSRVFFGEEQLEQPLLSSPQGVKVCHACATTCFLPNEAKSSDKTDGFTFVCGCGEGGRDCLLKARASPATVLAPGRLREAMIKDMKEQRMGQIQQIIAAEERTRLSAQSPEKQRFMQRVNSQYGQVMQYEDARLQDKARQVIPIARIQQEAAQSAEPVNGSVRDETAKRLLHWFKHEFFSWVNEAPCDACNGPTRRLGMDQPTPGERVHLAGAVEIFQCNNPMCNTITRFPRYNHAGKLLETRRGRCGEWVQAFVLCARAMGFDTRFVVDWTDHVWAEIFSETLDRYVHCDPCECDYDNPRVYAGGWGKKLTYVVAVSCEEVVDVAKRYALDYKQWQEQLQRRSAVPEDWLALSLAGVDMRIRQRLPVARQMEIQRRRLLEVPELDKVVAQVGPKEGDEDLKPRETGSQAWKEARGEAGPSNPPVAPEPSAQPKPSGLGQLEELMGELRVEAPDVAAQRQAVETLVQYINNILDNPNEQKFRTIPMDNPIFVARLGRFEAGKKALAALGFVADGPKLTLKADCNVAVELPTPREMMAKCLVDLTLQMGRPSPGHLHIEDFANAGIMCHGGMSVSGKFAYLAGRTAFWGETKLNLSRGFWATMRLDRLSDDLVGGIVMHSSGSRIGDAGAFDIPGGMACIVGPGRYIRVQSNINGDATAELFTIAKGELPEGTCTAGAITDIHFVFVIHARCVCVLVGDQVVIRAAASLPSGYIIKETTAGIYGHSTSQQPTAALHGFSVS